MSENNAVGFVTGTLTLQLSDNLPPISMGNLTLPLKVARIINDKTDGFSFGIGTDLEGVRRDIRAIFNSNEIDDPLSDLKCHCGEPVVYGYNGDPADHRGMCEHCDAMRCDTDPATCGRS